MSSVLDSLPVHRTMDFILRPIHPLVFVLLLGSVIPFLLLVRFAHPGADDFRYASLFSRDGF